MTTNELHRSLRNTTATIANAEGLDRGTVTLEAGQTVTIKGISYNGAEGRTDAQVETADGRFRTIALSALGNLRGAW